GPFRLMSDQNEDAGSKLEGAGWRQGAIVKGCELEAILKHTSFNPDDDLVVIVACQSCDIAAKRLESDPYIEVSIGRLIESSKGDLTFNKNARILHTNIHLITEDAEVYRELPIELKAFEKVQISKQLFIQISPDHMRVLNNNHLNSYVSWLAS